MVQQRIAVIPKPGYRGDVLGRHRGGRAAFVTLAGAADRRRAVADDLHIGYGWLACGWLLLGFNSLTDILPETAALHALTVGAIGTMTLAIMTGATLGHTGRPLTAGPVTKVIFGLVTAAAILRVLLPLIGAQMELALWLSGAAWSGAFGLFALCYGAALAHPRIAGPAGRPI